MSRRPGSVDVDQIDWREGISDNIIVTGSFNIQGKVLSQAEEKINKKAISLDGSNDHVLSSDQDDFSFTNGSNDLPFSLSLWVYVGDISSDDGPFISKANFTTGGNEFIFKHANGKLQFFLYDNDSSASGDSIRTQAPSATLSDATWHHVVATYSGNGSQTGIKVYTDGSQTTSTQSANGSYSRIRNTSTPVVIGATQDLANANRVFEDRIADCVVFNKELTSTEVAEIYNSGNVMNVRNHSAFANVVSWWKMGDDRDIEGSNGIIDYVSGYHGTLTNGASIIDESGLSSDKLDSLSTDASGSLGIGIKNPNKAFHVYGESNLEGTVTVTGSLKSTSLGVQTSVVTVGSDNALTSSTQMKIDSLGNVAVANDVFVSGNLKTENNISFIDKNGTFPTNTAGFFWDLNNDEARIYAKQPASDQIDLVFKLKDNNNSVDRYVYWIDDYRGGSQDRYPLVMHGSNVLFHMTETSEGVPDTGTSKARIDSSGRISMRVSSDPSTTSNYAHIYTKDVASSAEVFVRDEAGNVTQISPHNEEGEWQYFSRNTITGKVVKINMEKMIRKLEQITGESFMEEWCEDLE